MKTTVICALLSVLCIGSANANALWDLYAGAVVGVGGATMFADDNTVSNDANSFGAVVGLDLPIVRAELEYNYMTADDFHASLGMLNGYVKLSPTFIVPYIGAGIGVAANGDLDGSATAYQGMLGLTIDLEILPLKFDVEGRVLYIPDYMEFANTEPDMLQYEGRAKIRYIF